MDLLTLFVRLQTDGVATVGRDLTAVEAGAKKANTSLTQLQKTGSGMKAFGSSMQAVGSSMSKFVTLPLAVAGGAAVKFAADFEGALQQAVSVTGLTGQAADEARQKMSDLALELGAKTAFSAKDAADAMYDLASSGWSVKQMQEGLNGIMALAAATQSDLAQTTGIVVSAISQYGLKASESGRVSDVFTEAINASRIRIEDLGQAMGYVGPVAAGMGISLEETTAVLALMADSGIEASTAGTSLRAALASLANPIGQAAKELNAMGVAQEDVNPATHSLAEILQTLNKAGLDANGAIRLFGREGGPAMLAVSKTGVPALEKLTKSLEESGGTAERTAKMQLDTLKGAWEELSGSLETLAIRIGNTMTPALESLVRGLTPVVNWVGNLPAPVLAAGAAFAGFVAALGPILFIAGAVVSALGSLVVVTGTAGIGGALTVAAGAVGGFLVAAAPFVALAAGLVAAGIAIYRNWDKLSPIFWAVADAVGNVLKTALAGIMDDLGPLASFFKNVGGKMLENAAQKISDFGSALKDLAQSEAVANLGKKLGDIFDKIKPPKDSVWDKAIERMKRFFGYVEEQANKDGTGLNKIWTKLTDDTGALENARNRIGQFFTWIGGYLNKTKLPDIWAKLTDGTGALENARNRVQAIWSGITGFISRESAQTVAGAIKLWTGLRTGISSVLGGVRTVIGVVWSVIRTLVVQSVTQLVARVKAGWMQVRTATTSVWNLIRQGVLAAWNFIRSTVTRNAQLVVNGVRAAWNLARTVTTTAWNAVRQAISAAWNFIRSLATSAVRGVVSAVQAGWNLLRTTTTTAFNAVKAIIQTAWNTIVNICRTILNTVVTSVQNGWNTLRNATVSAWDSIRQSITSRITEAKSQVVSTVSNLVSEARSKFEAFKNAASEIFNAAKDAIVNPIKNAASEVETWVNKILDVVNGILSKVGLDPIGGGSNSESSPSLTGGSRPVQSFARGGTTGFRRFAKGGTVDKKRGGVSGPRGNYWHQWGEGDYHEAYLTTDPRFRDDNDRYAAWYATKVGGIYWPADSKKRAEQYLWMADRMDRGKRAGNVPLEDSGTQFSSGRPGRDMPMAQTVRRTYAEGGLSDDAAKAAQATVDWAHGSDGQPYAWGGSWPPTTDCSGWQNVVYLRYGGNSNPSGRMPFSATGNMASYVPSVASQRGTANPGYSVGYANGGPGGGHTAGTLAWGSGEINTETGGGAGGTMTGGPAWGATNSYFTDTYSFGSPGDVQGGGGGGGGFSIPNPMQILFEKLWKSLVKPVVDTFLDPLDNASYVLLNAAGKAARKVPEGIYKWIDEKIPDTIGGGGTGGGQAGPGGGSSSENRALGEEMLSASGVPGSFSSLDSLWQKESGWDNTAENPSSGAYGIPQALPGSKMGAAANPPDSNPRAQIDWGLGYIQERYGSTDSAWDHSQSVGWYEKGGLALGPQLQVLAEKGKEMILPLEGMQAQRAAQSLFATNSLKAELSEMKQELAQMRTNGIKSHITGMDDAPAGKLVAGTQSQVRQIMRGTEGRDIIRTQTQNLGRQIRGRGGVG